MDDNPSTYFSAPPTQGEQHPNKSDAGTQALLTEILETLHESDLFTRSAKDPAARYWRMYERVAKQHDEEFLDRQNTTLDSHLIFAGLFSAVSSAFIVDMGSSLHPDPTDVTNALLMNIFQRLDGTNQTVDIPLWTGPAHSDIWIQGVAYASLAASLLAAFGSVLGKQWLAHYKSSRFGSGSLEERGLRRHRLFLGLQTAHFGTILECLAVLLQISLALFGIAISARLWILQQTLGWILIFAVALGAIFYFLTFFAAVISPHTPFASKLTSLLAPSWRRLRLLLRRTYTILHYILVDVRKGGDWDSDTASLDPRLPTIDSLNLLIEKVLIQMEERRQIPPPKKAQTIEWLLETSTDPEVTLAAITMVPLVNYPRKFPNKPAMRNISYAFLACFDNFGNVTRGAEEDAVKYAKSIILLEIQNGVSTSIDEFYSNLKFHPDIQIWGYFAKYAASQEPPDSSEVDLAWLFCVLPGVVSPRIVIHRPTDGDEPENPPYLQHFSHLLSDDIYHALIRRAWGHPSVFVRTSALASLAQTLGIQFPRNFIYQPDKSFLLGGICECIFEYLPDLLAVDRIRGIPHLAKAFPLIFDSPFYVDVWKEMAHEVARVDKWSMSFLIYVLQESPLKAQERIGISLKILSSAISFRGYVRHLELPDIPPIKATKDISTALMATVTDLSATEDHNILWIAVTLLGVFTWDPQDIYLDHFTLLASLMKEKNTLNIRKAAMTALSTLPWDNLTVSNNAVVENISGSIKEVINLCQEKVELRLATIQVSNIPQPPLLSYFKIVRRFLEISDWQQFFWEAHFLSCISISITQELLVHKVPPEEPWLVEFMDLISSISKTETLAHSTILHCWGLLATLRRNMDRSDLPTQFVACFSDLKRMTKRCFETNSTSLEILEIFGDKGHPTDEEFQTLLEVLTRHNTTFATYSLFVHQIEVARRGFEAT